MHIPPGTLIRDRAGRIVTRVSITPIPNDRPPYPMPEIAEFPVYFTAAARRRAPRKVSMACRDEAQVIYPNYTNLPPGTELLSGATIRCCAEWHVYGMGTVTDDGQHIVPDPGVGLYSFTGFSVATNLISVTVRFRLLRWRRGVEADHPGDSAGGGPPDGLSIRPNANCGDPVQTVTGQFTHFNTDLRCCRRRPAGVAPPVLLPRRAGARFGRGMMASLEMYLYNPVPGTYNQFWLVTSNGGCVVLTCTLRLRLVFDGAPRSAV